MLSDGYIERAGIKVDKVGVGKQVDSESTVGQLLFTPGAVTHFANEHAQSSKFQQACIHMVLPLPNIYHINLV